MAESVKTIKEWLNTLPDSAEIGINEGGLALEVVDSPDEYYEIGGMPEADERGISRLSLLLAALVLFLILIGLAPLSGMAQRPRVVAGAVQGQQQEVKTLKKDGSEVYLCGALTKAGGKCKRHVKVAGARCFSHKGK